MLSLLNPRHAELKSKMVPETSFFFFMVAKKLHLCELFTKMYCNMKKRAAVALSYRHFHLTL